MDTFSQIETFVKSVFQVINRFPSVDEPALSIIKESDVFENMLFRFSSAKSEQEQDRALNQSLEAASDLAFAALLYIYLWRPQSAEEIFSLNVEKITKRICENGIGLMPPGGQLKLASYFRKEIVARDMMRDLLRRM